MEVIVVTDAELLIRQGVVFATIPTMLFASHAMMGRFLNFLRVFNLGWGGVLPLHGRAEWELGYVRLMGRVHSGAELEVDQKKGNADVWSNGATPGDLFPAKSDIFDTEPFFRDTNMDVVSAFQIK